MTQDDQRAFAPHHPLGARALFDSPQYGRELKGQEEEGDCNLMTAFP